MASDLQRRRLLAGASAASALAAMGASPAARADDKILIGYWPIASGLPLYVGLERGIFKEAGLNVEGVKFASAQQVAEAMISGRIHGSANGTASAVLGLAEITSPNLFKIICSNPSNKSLVLDEFVVPKDSPVKSIAELAGKKVASGPGIQNVTLAKIILEKNGIANPTVTELPVGQHVPALAAGQIDAVYTLEPTGTAGRLKGLARVLETGVIAKYVLGNADAPWFGGSASVTNSFIKDSPDLAKRYIAAYGKAVEWVRKQPEESRKHMDGFTAIEEALVKEVPLSGFTLYNEFSASDLGYFQKFFDVFTERKIFSRKLDVKSLLYTA
ncbi:ABC transporter substrate-binding protein [Ideonella azotifigens]|uniref:SsuA/THI5-like domain-containing protein n=1 Tax=Ideonella azotifigens TaxID=513160 RepID=A0ABN1K0A3_9BURK|nr:ABC transporter substrate-binding protein [Ideonella azotifigens]MCD2342625.1 ABC transporter substrate-binding protein [Ideonella azotifigens]